MISNHLKFINKAHQIASKNLGKTFPNPSVGCLICKNNQIISKAVTSSTGRPHAEETALKKAEQEPKNLEMFMLIEHLSGQIESIEKEIEASRYNKVNIDHLKEQVDNINKQIEKLRNGNH